MTSRHADGDASMGHEGSTDIAEILERRVIIGEAKGILMERLGLDRDEAFAFLRRRSQELNVKLYTLADELVRTGVLP